MTVFQEIPTYYRTKNEHSWRLLANGLAREYSSYRHGNKFNGGLFSEYIQNEDLRINFLTKNYLKYLFRLIDAMYEYFLRSICILSFPKWVNVRSYSETKLNMEEHHFFTWEKLVINFELIMFTIRELLKIGYKKINGKK